MMAFGFGLFGLLHLLGEGWFGEWGITIRCYVFALLGRRMLGVHMHYSCLLACLAFAFPMTDCPLKSKNRLHTAQSDILILIEILGLWSSRFLDDD